VAEKRVLIPVDAIFTLFAWLLLHTRTTFTSPLCLLSVLTRRTGIWASAPTRGCHRRSARHPNARTEIGSPGMPQAFHNQPHTLACCRSDVRTECMDFSAHPSTTSFALRSGYAREVPEPSLLRQEIHKDHSNLHKKNDRHRKIAYLPAMGHPSAFSALASLAFAFGLSRHSKQSEASSYHQKQSSHSSLGLCSIVVQAFHDRPGSALAPTARHRVFHDVYQLAVPYKK
jgi:hypothetical protein